MLMLEVRKLVHLFIHVIPHKFSSAVLPTCIYRGVCLDALVCFKRDKFWKKLFFLNLD